MKMLVSGGLGFIGSNLVDALVEEGHDVHVVDNLKFGYAEYENDKATYYIADITDYKKMLELTKDVDVIFHEAAWARVQRSVNMPLETNENNVTGTLNLLEAARQNRVKRFIFASSSSVYGEQQSPIMSEWMQPKPMHPYALQKWAGEEYCRLYSKLYDLPTVCLRYFNVYGPRQIVHGDYALVIGKFLLQRREGRKATVYGDGTQTRAYTHVSDVVRANILASTFDMGKENHGVFNIGTDVESSVNDIVKLLGMEAEYIIPNPRGDFEEKRKYADNTLSSIVLKWIPQVSIEEGITDLLERE